jgi:predicted Ser/Thr protein kinase
MRPIERSGSFFATNRVDTCPKKSANFVCRFFFTGKYETTKQAKKSRIFSLAEKISALSAVGVETRELDHVSKKNEETRFRRNSSSAG